MEGPDDSKGKRKELDGPAGELKRTPENASGSPSSEHGTTIRDARALWGGAVSPESSLSKTIRARAAQARLTRVSKLQPPVRRIAEAEPGKEALEESDFALIGLLGEGSMGMVFSARQESLDREIAIKMIQSEAATDSEARSKFLAEAMVTGELEHPNMVPIHDFGGTPEGTLFYAMKQVRGTSWDNVIREKSLEDNLAVFLSVCDAVAFAHDKGVIHRDLKPENVMLGDYGEVLVVDWGLAASIGSDKAEPLTAESGLAGTPAYMAPEMAKCEIGKVGPSSDIYLLGGILYEIVTGLRPHTGKDVYACIHAAMENIIQPTDEKSELIQTALRAMATEPQARYASVKDFQQELREYQRHGESLKLSSAAGERLRRTDDAAEGDLYRECTEIIAGFQQALELWRGNASAMLGLRKAREAFAEAALERGDLALARSEVAAMESECRSLPGNHERLDSPVGLADRVDAAILEAARKERVARLSRWGAVGAGTLMLIVSVLAYWITKGQRDRAVVAERDALGAKAEETRQRQTAEEALRRAERENYYNVIGLADAKIADSQMDQAETLLWNTAGDFRLWEWGRLIRACHQELLTLRGHSESVTSVAFSPDGNRMVTGSQDGTANVWDAESGLEIASLKGHTSYVYSVSFSPDGRRVATGSYDRTAKVWEMESGKEILTLKGHLSGVSSVAFCPDGNRVLTGSNDNTAKLWDARDGDEILTLTGHLNGVNSVAVSPEGKRAATASDDNTAKVWDIESGDLILTLSAHSGFVRSVAFSPDGKRIATGSWDSTARVWDAESGDEILTLRGHSKYVMSVSFSPDGRRLATGGYDNTAKVWDTTTGRELLTLRGHSRLVSGVTFSPGGSRLVTGSYDKMVKVWDTQGARDTLTLGVLSGPVSAIAFSPSGRRIVTGSSDGTATLWDVESGRELSPLKRHSDDIAFAAFSGDEKRVVTAGRDNTLKVWNVESGEEVLTVSSRSSSVTCAALSPEGKRIITGSHDGTAILSDAAWEVGTGQPELTLTGHSGSVSSVGFSPDGKRVVTGSYDMTARVWDTENGQELLTLTGHSRSVTSVCFSPNGRRVVTASTDDTARVWDAESGREIVTLKGHFGGVNTAIFSPDGKRVLTGSSDGTAKVWDAENGREVLTLRGHSGYVNCAVFSPDGERVATGSSDRTARVWDAFGWEPSPEGVERQARERYTRWLDKVHAGMQAAPEESAVPTTSASAQALLAEDTFDGTLGLDWEILHPDPTHYSLSKNPGTLTITTQEGGFARSSTNYRNLFLIDCPLSPGEDFQITTYLSRFRPVADWNQAGLICYNDDDNYLKWNCERSDGGSVVFALGRETQGELNPTLFSAPSGLDSFWLRVTKRGYRYTVSTSFDGEAFRSHGEFGWGDGAIKRVGLFAKNGPDSLAPEVDALFDFFEVRAVPAETR